jgi:hypothetical protein
VQAAIARFEMAAPDADLLRHLHVHFDAYLRGRGQDADRLSDPVDAAGTIIVTERGLVYWLGGKLFFLQDLVQAAEKLAVAIPGC